MNNWLNLEGEVCAVTGALGGMGVEICREFARNGANVVLLDLDEEKVKTAAAGLSDEFGIHAEGYRMDATNEDEVQAAVDATIRDFGRVDALVNTAGILRFSPMEDLPLSDWEAVIKVNLTGTFIASQRFGREMIRQGAGRLVHISTAASYQPETFSGVYSSTKAGVNMMSKMMAAEWGPYGVVDGGFSNMMGDLTAKPGGRRAYAENYLKNKGVSLWTDGAGVKTPSDQ